MSSIVKAAETTQESLAKIIHRTTSKIVGLFVLFHLFNHLFALASPQKHIAIMNVFRIVYRQPILEAFLILAVALQVVSGVILFVKGRKLRKSLYDKLQAYSGLYLSFFFVIHVLAVLLLGRYLFKVDTNFYFASAGLQQLPSALFFVPYYSMSVLSFGIHITCSLHQVIARRYGKKLAKQLALILICITVIATSLIMFAFSGLFYPIHSF